MLEGVDGVTSVQQRKMFAKSADVHVNFKYCGQPYIVWEPYGDNSRYWIGPDDQVAVAADVIGLEEAFKSYRPPLYRAVLGDLFTLRFITRFVKPSEK